MASPSKLPSRRPAAAGGRSRPVSMIEGPMLNLNLNVPASTETTSKQAKRRSLLPQFARKFSGEQVIKEDEEAGEMATKSNSVADDVAGSHEELPQRSIYQDEDRRTMPRPTTLGRPTSVFGAGGLGRAPSVRSHAREALRSTHARADALAALTGSAPSAAPRVTAPDSGMKRTSSTRVPQAPATRGLTRTASVKPKEPPARTSSTAKAMNSVPMTSVAEKRSSITRTRPTSIDSSAKASPPSVTSPASPASSATSRQSSTRPQSQVLPPAPRPSFSTFQQHYSPAKSALPKPPIPSARASRPQTVTEEDAAPSFDVMKQQSELLSLSLLHQTSLRTMQEYDASAKRKLGRKQAKLRKEYGAIRALEEEQARIANLTALDMWCPDAALLAENLQIASKVYSELAALAEDAGKHTQLVTRFEHWIDRAESTMSGHDSTVAFVEALPQDWHKAHTLLALRLRALQRDLSMLSPAPKGHTFEVGSLQIMLESCTTLLDSMLKELRLVSKLERMILQREKARIDDAVKALTLDNGIAGPQKDRWVPAWQSVA